MSSPEVGETFMMDSTKVSGGPMKVMSQLYQAPVKKGYTNTMNRYIGRSQLLQMLVDGRIHKELKAQSRLAKFLLQFMPFPDEVAMNFEFEFNHCVLNGTIDACTINGEKATIVEFEERENIYDPISMVTYALALKEKYPGLRRFNCYHYDLSQDQYDFIQLSTSNLSTWIQELESVTDIIKTIAMRMFQTADRQEPMSRLACNLVH